MLILYEADVAIVEKKQSAGFRMTAMSGHSRIMPTIPFGFCDPSKEAADRNAGIGERGLWGSPLRVFVFTFPPLVPALYLFPPFPPAAVEGFLVLEGFQQKERGNGAGEEADEQGDRDERVNRAADDVYEEHRQYDRRDEGEEKRERTHGVSISVEHRPEAPPRL